MLEIRVPKDTPLYESRLKLSGVEWWLRFDYSEREDRWTLYLLDSAKVLFAGPMRVACGRDLLARSRWKSNCPPGTLLAIDPSGTRERPGAPPGFSDFGRRVRLFYDEDT